MADITLTIAEDNKITLGGVSEISERIIDDYEKLSNLPTLNGETIIGDMVESDPTVPSWAKQTNKPTYTASEVGALPNTTVIPTKLSDLSDYSALNTRLDGIDTEIDKKADDDTLATVAKSGDYNDLSNKPSIPTVPTKLSDLEDDSTHRVVTDAQISTWNSGGFSGDYNDLTNKPTIPSQLSQLSSDSIHRTVTDEQISSWDNGFSGDYNDLTNKPTIPSKTSDLTNDSGYTTFSGSYNDLTNKPTIPTKTSELVNDSSFSTFSGNYEDLTNKPTIPTSASDLGAVSQNDYNIKMISVDSGISTNAENITTLDGRITSVSSSIPTSASQIGGILSSEKGAVNGVATLGEDGIVPTSQLPSYVSDVVEGTIATFPQPGKTSVIYVDTETNKTYRWGGSAYTEISASIAIGDTSETAYMGSKGKALETTVSDIKSVTDNLKTVATSGSYTDLTNKPTKVSDFTNDSGFITSSDIPEIPSKLADLTDDSTHRVVSDADITKWDSAADKHIDNEMSDTSENAVKNKVIKKYVDDSIPSLDSKQDKLSETQMYAVNSGITATKVSTYDGYASTISGKVDKVTGKGLSTNDYTTDEKTKLSGIASGAEVNVQSDWNVTNTSSDAYIANKPTIPTALSQLSDDTTHRTVTDSDKQAWNAKSNFSGNYNDLTNKPTIPSALSDLSTDTTHRVVTDTEKSNWNGKQDGLDYYSESVDTETSETISTFSANINSLNGKMVIDDGYSTIEFNSGVSAKLNSDSLAYLNVNGTQAGLRITDTTSYFPMVITNKGTGGINLFTTNGDTKTASSSSAIKFKQAGASAYTSMGTADISSVGDGSILGAISALNTAISGLLNGEETEF